MTLDRDPLFDQSPVGWRDGQPCACPDAHRETHTFLDYCPQHDARPDPTLWDYTADTRYLVTDPGLEPPDGAVIEWPPYGPGRWVRHGDEWVPYRTVTVQVTNSYACGRTSDGSGEVECPPPGADMERWWNEEVTTGDGHPCGAGEHALYEALIVAAPLDRPDLIGLSMSWEG